MRHPAMLTAMRSPKPDRPAPGGTGSEPPFPEVTVVLGDPRLPDRTKVGGRFGPEESEAIVRLKAALGTLPGYRFRYLDDHGDLLTDLLERRPAFVLNFCDTGYGNVATREPHVPALLELLEIPYSGAAPACLGLCYDKGFVRAVAADCGVAVPREMRLEAGEEVEAGVPPWFPALVKPACGDGSVGITPESLVHDAAQTVARLRSLRTELPGASLLVQEFLPGVEYGVGLIGNPGLGLTALPPLEVDYSGLDPALPPILAYASKSVPESPYWTEIRYREARLGAEPRRRLIDDACRLFQRLGCRDYARLDFRAGADGEIRLLEVNPNPAWCWDGKLNLMAGFAGVGYTELLERILGAAQARCASARGAVGTEGQAPAASVRSPR